MKDIGEGYVHDAVSSLKARLSDLLCVRKERLVALSMEGDKEEIPEWHTPPDRVLVEDLLVLPTPNFNYVNIYYREKHMDFILKVEPDIDNSQFVMMVASVVNVNLFAIDLRDQRGERWIYPTSLQMSSVVTLNLP